MASQVDEQGVQVQLRVGAREIEIPAAHIERGRRFIRTVWREPFTRRTWSELLFFCLSGLLAGLAFAVVTSTLLLGVLLAITFIGVILIAAAVREARGLGSLQRRLARKLLGEDIADPNPFQARPGFFGWLQTALRDTTGWRAVAYAAAKVPLTVFGVYFALSVWLDAFVCLIHPVFGGGSVPPPEFGIVKNLFPPGFLSVATSGFIHGLFIFLTGVLLFFVAPWPMRGVLWVDRHLLRALLGPDAVTRRVRSLEEARSRTVENSAATLRQIERDLHDGTQAQLVALAMRLGQAKEKLTSTDEQDLSAARRLVDEAHQGVKEAIVELRDLVRGIHPPALDTGLEGALSTLAARSPLPTDLTVSVQERPTPAIESIAYFCVAELLANATQHAQASRASVSCNQHGAWLRLVVRDDGCGGARPAAQGSTSSGLRGLLERVRAVDGFLNIASPPGGPTVVTVDLPLHP
jgi:signal transduction histidine kinase